MEYVKSIKDDIHRIANSVESYVKHQGIDLKKDKKSSSSEDEKDEPSPHDTESKEHHLDAGTTILHAFQKLNPDQVLQMRNDTKELMETQKQLVETLSSLGPQVQQGAELVKSFQGMFGGNIAEVVKQ